jgi:hypothetical protein
VTSRALSLGRRAATTLAGLLAAGNWSGVRGPGGWEATASDPPTWPRTPPVPPSVTLVSATRAKVVYTLLEDGRPARANQLGVAVYQDGTWKVGVATFCSLLATENGGRTSLLPTACKAAG